MASPAEGSHILWIDLLLAPGQTAACLFDGNCFQYVNQYPPSTAGIGFGWLVNVAFYGGITYLMLLVVRGLKRVISK